jgi:hypothetical protein
LVEIIVAWILPIGNFSDIVMVLVVIGQVEKIAANKRIVHINLSQQRYGSGKCHGLRVGRVTSCK